MNGPRFWPYLGVLLFEIRLPSPGNPEDNHSSHDPGTKQSTRVIGGELLDSEHTLKPHQGGCHP